MNPQDSIVLADPQTVAEFQPVIAALRRGTRRGRLRLLEIACQNNHQLGEVFGPAQRPVLLARGRVQLQNGRIQDGHGALREQLDSKLSISDIRVKSADEGRVEAVFSTFSVIDKDNDITLPGAFTDGTEVLVSAYQHQSWAGALPVGKGVIRQTDREAIVNAQFFMDTTHGRDTFAVVKSLGGRQQWSFAFDILDAEYGEHDGRKVRYLKALDVHEVSPVLIGAGVNTRTLATKSGLHAVDSPADVAAREHARFIKGQLEDSIRAELWDIAARIQLDADVAQIARRFRRTR